MLKNLSGKQGFLLGILSGAAIMAIGGYVITTALLLNKQTPPLADRADNTQQAPTVAEQNAPAASDLPTAITKSARPTAELFVMSYCPYGMDMEQNAFIPAYNLLKKNADISIKFVSYAMHGKQEVEENTRQYCAQTQDTDKYFKYLNCFNGSGNSASCIQQAGIDEKKLNRCIDGTNDKYAILDKYNDQTTWLNGRYPIYPIHEQLNNTYGVQGSPTLVINGTQVTADRTANGVISAICAAFDKAPAECSQFLSQSGNTQPVATNKKAGACGG